MQFDGALDELVRNDPRYPRESYEFMMEALAYTVKTLGERRHVSGRELLVGVRDYALDCWGPMARRVLESWGIRRTEDFGEVVFNLVGAGLLSKTDGDSKDDFKKVFRFEQAFDPGDAVPELDEFGHVRRKGPRVRLDGSIHWLPFFGETGAN